MTIWMYDLCGAEEARRFSPFCWRINMALAHKGLDYETVAWRFGEQETIAPLGSKTVPVISDGDRHVSDSWAIAEYLEDTYPDAPSLFPNGRAEARFIKSWSEVVLSPGISPMVVYDIYRHVGAEQQPYFRDSREARFGAKLEDIQATRDDRIEAFRASLNPLRITLGAQDWVAGETPGFADHMCFAPFMWARSISDYQLLAVDDSLNGWRNRMLDLYDGLCRKAPGYSW